MISKEQAKEKLEKLVGDFEAEYRHINTSYTEEDTKQKLIQRLFGLLGWDFTKDQDVSYERSGKKSGRPDYVLGNRHFYLEAKAVSVDLNNHIPQANVYAYNLGRFCVLTNFKEFKLIKPVAPVDERPQAAIVELFNLDYTQYLNKFDILWNTFSKEAVLVRESLDILLEQEKKKRHFYSIDEDFLNRLEKWRKEIAQDIYLNNKTTIDTDDKLLTAFTQRILDRIVFSKFLEDRNIEDSILRDLVGINNVYQKMAIKFREIGRVYNGLIYNTSQVDGLTVSDKVLNDILEQLYDTPKNQAIYKFDLIPIEILGSIYERFLGKVLKINPSSGKVNAVDKPEVAKAKGVYYTPDNIVRHIVINTVGRLVENKSAEKVSKIRVADISCGSGSFLVGAYSYLLKWYLEYYTQHQGYANKDKALLNGKLTRSIRKKILVRHIFGVDIDPQACEVTQMSLYLAMLEDCPDLQREIRLHELILPDMKNNIKCGNSLIGPDYFLSNIVPDIKNMEDLNAFDWKKNFPDGFDCVIGNPPYIDSETMTKIYPLLRKAIQETYSSTKGNWDIYIAFFEKGLSLVRPGGYLSFITPDKWISKPFGDQLRKDTFDDIESIYNAGRDVFKRAKVDAIVTIFSKNHPVSIRIFTGPNMTLQRTVKKKLLHPPYAYDGLFSDLLELLNKIENQPRKLSDLGRCENACSVADCYKLKEYIEDNKQGKTEYLTIINTGTIGKYLSKWGEKEMVYLGKRYQHPTVIKNHFLSAFPNSYGKKSIRPKIILKGLNLLDACVDFEGKVIPGKTTLMIPSDNQDILKLLLAIINSKLIFLYITEKYPAANWNKGTQFTTEMIDNIPLPIISNIQKKEVLTLVDKIIALKKQRSDADTSVFEDEINRKIYEIYGLTKEEYLIVDNWKKK